MLKTIRAAAGWLWRNEPAVVGGVTTALVSVGVITGEQGANLSSAVESLVAAGVSIAAAFGVRARVRPTGRSDLDG